MKNEILFNGLKVNQILTQNGKLKKTSKENNKRIFNFGISAYKTSKGKVVCPFADSCVKFCYAKKGAYTWGNVAPVYEKRYNLTQSDEFIKAINYSLKAKKVDILRIHDSGDFYSRKYIDKWLTIAQENKNIIFYAYTKSIPLFIDILDKLPDNFKIIFSEGSKVDNLIDIKKHRHARIFKTEKDLLDARYSNASKNDLIAIGDNKKIGLIYH